MLVQGRIVSRRDQGSVHRAVATPCRRSRPHTTSHSNALVFLTLRDVNDDTGAELQVQLQADVYQSADFEQLFALLRRGDIIDCYGCDVGCVLSTSSSLCARSVVVKTKRGELTVRASRVQLRSGASLARADSRALSRSSCVVQACLLPWQLNYDDRGFLHAKRHIDLLAHPHVVEVAPPTRRVLHRVRLTDETAALQTSLAHSDAHSSPARRRVRLCRGLFCGVSCRSVLLNNTCSKSGRNANIVGASRSFCFKSNCICCLIFNGFSFQAAPMRGRSRRRHTRSINSFIYASRLVVQHSLFLYLFFLKISFPLC